MYVLAAAVFLNIISAGQSALIQGMRRISDLAKMSVLGALFGTLATIPLVYFFREDGVAPSLVAVAAMTLAFSWWYSRKLSIETHSLTVVEVWREASTLLKLGIAFMVSNLLMMGSAYVVRIVLQHKAGLEATGLYQSAWTIGGLYVGMILQSMGADFYPRLTAAVHQHGECNRLVNEQARISMLLAGPGVLATLVFAPLVISAFYAASFGAAVEVLRWICMGIAMRVISWPMGFIIMAKGQQNLILLCEVSWTLVHLGLVWILIDTFGVDGAGIAFFASYVFHVGLTYAIVHNLTGFRWSGDNRQTALLYTSLIAAVFCGFQILPDVWASLFGVLAALLSGIYSLRAILTLTGNVRVFQVAQALASRLGLSGKVTAA